MVDHKPLPELPSTSKTPNLARLSIQAQKHRERFIRFVLSELNDAWIDNNLEEWTRVLEDALDDLASSMSQGRWLTGIKKYKALKEKQSKKKRKLDKKVDLTENSTGPRKSTGADGIFDNGSKKSEVQISSSNSERLERLRQIVAEPDVPSRTPKSRHLLLCLAPLGSRVALPDEDSGFNLVPSTLGCSFRNSVFVLPEGGEEMDAILYGFHEWNTSVEEMSTRPVGGTFTLKGVPSLQQHRALSKALKLTVYVHLSLLLEQQLLIDSHAHLTFAQPRVRVQAGTLQPSALPSHNQNTPTNDAASSHKPRSLIPSGIFSFFSKRSPGRTSSPRDASSVRPSSDSVPFPSIEEVQPVRSSMDEMNSAARLRMFSFLSSSAPEAEPQKGPTSTPFSDTLARIEAQRNVLSSSTGVVFDPPMLLVRLAEKEKAHREKEICLTGDERVALNSLLGWGTVESEANQLDLDKDKRNESWIKKGKGMTGICGFVNQQEISILVSSHVPLAGACVPQEIGPEASMSASTSSAPSVPREASSSSQASHSSDSSSTTNKPSPLKTAPTHTSCEQPHWTVYRYYVNSDSGTLNKDHDKDDDNNAPPEDSPRLCVNDRDQCLGEVIKSWIDEADVPCDRLRAVSTNSEHRGGIGLMHGLGGSSTTTTEKRCEVQVGKHERRFVHGGVKVSASIEWPAVKSLAATSLVLPTIATSAGGSDESNVDEKDQSPDARVVSVWESCSICGAETKKNELSEGAYLFSFAKYLELLIYSPLLCKLSPRLCEHTDPSSTSSSSTSSTRSISSNLPPQRFNIIRHFSASSSENDEGGSSGVSSNDGNRREYTVSFKIDPVKDIFELRVPRLQISNWRVEGDSDTLGFVSTLNHKGEKEHYASKEDDQKKKLRREIKAWWEGVADHMDLLEEKFSAEDQIAVRKALPRLPSTDDAYDSFDDDDFGEPEEYPTPKLKISGLPESYTPTVVTATSDYFNKSKNPSSVSSDPFTLSASSSTAPLCQIPPQPHSSSDDISRTASPSPAPSNPRPPLNHGSSSSSSQLSTTPTTSSASSVHSADAEGLNRDPMQLLSNLRQTFHRIEQTLYTQLAKTPASSLNEVRRAFLSAAKGAERRLTAWQKKHLGEKKGKKKNKVKNGERSDELNPSEKLRAAEPEWWNPTCHVAPGGNIIIREDDWGSIIAFTLSTPDYQRELASMSVVRPASNADPPNTPIAPSTSASSFFSAATASGYKLFRTSALVQPDPDQEDVIWHEPEAYSAVICRKDHPRDPTSILSIREVLRQKSPDSNLLSASRFASLGSATSKKLNGGRGDRPSMLSNGVPPSAWAKPDVQVTKQEAEGEVASGLTHGRDDVHRMLLEFESIETEDTESRPNSSVVGSYNSSTLDASTVRPDPHAPQGAFVAGNHAKTISQNSPSPSDTISAPNSIASPVPAKSSLDSFTNGLTNAMRLMLPTQIPRPLSAGSDRHHGLLTAAEVNAIDERPHIKYDWTIGKRLKFSCMVYYAKQFDSLRKRCGVDSIFLESLSRSANWSAEGGKSKSNFWKTADDRFIIKTLVNAWNVADLQVLIELSPSYFRYMDSTASKATVLAKLIGFYTIEIRNLETGTVQSKADLLVMENLFYDQKIDKTFDLKGIQGRKVKSGNNVTVQTSKTLFDGEWIEGLQQTLTLVRPHSKAVLREAIRSDAEFLSKSNIMDYSLLLGIDTEHKQIACGLVDTIGSYTFAKTLEYKAKQGLNSGNGKEVTVIPPAEYQERFTNALERYFLACPDKWSRSLDRRKMISNPDLLPSVL
ncbi:uncharacterized protein C8R40DRAFT_814762 [Lentinula edodes]|uniref:uncharacterized protein n=1 Tax=Lentinula edodes TaxID=5353 RepID=UPI001E8D50AA|nr:uncharacterized protein C8R40DRAFT_814762 [Lentinula edodes]KAH7868609.1 hypothetical protein C8R40DRAFT_814762 [Lentinula edodes]